MYTSALFQIYLFSKKFSFVSKSEIHFSEKLKILAKKFNEKKIFFLLKMQFHGLKKLIFLNQILSRLIKSYFLIFLRN